MRSSVRSDVLTREPPFDEAIRFEEHIDLSLMIREAGGTLWLEPQSIVTYLTPRLRPSDLPYYVLRWSDDWNRRRSRGPRGEMATLT